MAVGFLINRLELTIPGSDWHERMGIAVAVMVLLRLLWGITWAKGPARLSAMRPTLASISVHIHEVRARSAHRSLGHNPVGMIGIWLFWFGLLLVALSGWAQTTFLVDTLPVTLWHSTLVDIITVLVVVHILAVVSLSLWLKRNLILMMLPGRQR